MKNLKMKSMAVMMLCILIMSCGNKNVKKETVVDMHTSSISVDWEGTYVGMTTAADCPGKYVMLSLDSTNFEMMSKYLDRQGIYVDKGKFSLKKDTIMVGNVPYYIAENMLFNDVDTLYKLNEDKLLPDAIKKQLLKETKGSQTAVLQEYIMDDKKVAKFNFLSKEYGMSINDNNTQEIEYVDGTKSLTMGIIDPAPVMPIKPIFQDGTKRYEFSIVSPSNYIYMSGRSPFFDVVYCNDNKHHYAMLLSDDIKNCYVLPMTSTSNKGTEYANEEVKWTKTSRGAEFKKGNKIIKYNQSNLTK